MRICSSHFYAVVINVDKGRSYAARENFYKFDFYLLQSFFLRTGSACPSELLFVTAFSNFRDTLWGIDRLDFLRGASCLTEYL